MPDDEAIIEADLTWLDGRFQAGVQVVVTGGIIAKVGRLGRAPTQRLSGRALLPGLVNAHSHAFQRGLRGRGETYPQGAGTFWTWREAMYALVRDLTPDEFRRHCRRAFHEMLRAGITTVGEFHYLHHADPVGRDYALDDVLVETAGEVGIRLVLIETAYRTGGFGEPLLEAQRRFDTHSTDGFLQQLDRLGRRLDDATQSLAIAAHSVRAVPAEEIVELHREAARRDVAFHMHLEEQRREVQAAWDHLGAPPMAWLLDHIRVDARCVAVHATHAEPDRLERWLRTGGRICLCPLTEANLGDGIADVARIAPRRGAMCVGSDCNTRIDLFEEIRWLEYTQRLHRQRRGVCIDTRSNPAARLLDAATIDGAEALGVAAGRIEPGRVADFCTLDLAHPILEGVSDDSLAAAIVFGATAECVRDVCVAGRWCEVRSA